MAGPSAGHCVPSRGLARVRTTAGRAVYPADTMWKLTIEDDEGQRTSLDLTLEEYAVGRAEESDIRLTERNISRKHAVIRKTDDGWVLVDEGSYNGSYVNGARADDSGLPVISGDIVNLGDYRIEIEDSTVTAAAEPARKRRPDRLICVIGPTPGAEFTLNGDRISLGRAEEATICINHASVSRLHTELHNLGQSRWEVVDQGSSNGVRINGVELRRGIIEPGDALELGDVRLRFVAAGKFYRPVVDMSQQLPGIEGMAGPAGVPANDKRLGTVVAALAICGLLGLGAWAMFSGPGPETSPSDSPPMAATDEEAEQYLKNAKASGSEGDWQKAHQFLQGVPESSPVYESADYRDLEDKWADWMFAKADEAESAEDKRKVLNIISETESVSLEKRQKAADMALEIAPDKPPPRIVYPPGVPRPTPVPGKTTGPAPKTTSKKPEPDKGTTGDDKFDMSKLKPGLVAKMNSGTASQQDLRLLMNICGMDGDTACRNAAFAAWKAGKDK
jgi:pSer/pThr/pTyr-binding forkhead associated (FHA) protein